ncbi:DUF1656 domain-containing protein [Herbaspirillum autotrophicum]|uniref:DUF1656 domain-containing protein n=1 Tax=Herbaspirillum autotrophicum TaxID=180195 RepID=UPI00067E1470|nr:DUF1656 domain-containing protein [Herbaspirillum autotrophicum]
MPREISLFDAYVPALLLLTFLSGLITIAADRLLVRLGLYDFVWHASLFRVSLFVCILGVLGLAVYR